MRWVDQAVTRPHRCAVVPYAQGPFIDTLQDLDLEHVYISAAGAQEVARMVGYVHPSIVDAQAEEVARLKSRVEELEAELQEADQFAQNIDGLMKHGYVPKRAAGRPPKKEPV